MDNAGKPARKTGPLGAEVIGPPACPIMHRWTLVRVRGRKLLLHHFLPNADDRAEHDHPAAHHEVSGGCLIEGCGCSGFKVLTRAQRAAARTTRCSGCGRHVQEGGPHGRELNPTGRNADGPCPRNWLGPDRAESWTP